MKCVDTFIRDIAVVVPTSMLCIELLKVHEVFGKDIMRLVCGMWRECDEDLVEYWRSLLNKAGQLEWIAMLATKRCLVFSGLSLESFLVKLKLDNNVLLVADVRLSMISPLVDVVLHMRHLGCVMINDEVRESVRNVTGLDPNTTWSTGLWL